MTVHLHDYGQVGLGAGGAPINYAEVSRLIRASRELAPVRHDFHSLVAAESATALRSVIRPGDTLVCTAGPYAHLYHYWREQLGLDFRIVRDARTTAWTPYLAQEWLAAPLLRPGDDLIVPSHFARLFYAGLFPGQPQKSVHVLYPMAHHLPAERAERRNGSGPLRIGFLGRIADDKNITAAFEFVREIQRERPAELHLAGAFQPVGKGLPGAAAIPGVEARLGLAKNSVVYHGNLPYEEIWRFLGDLDVLYFPAVSSNESFGRVLLEAGRAGVPVIATDFAAAPELVPAGNLIPVAYSQLDGVKLSSALSMGAPDTSAALRILAAGASIADPSAEPRYSAGAFLDLVRLGRAPPAETYVPSAGVGRFLAGLHVSGLPVLDRQQALQLCRQHLRIMRTLHNPGLPRLRALACLLPYLRGDAILKQVARERLTNSAPLGVLRNAVAIARLLGFDPRLTLAGPAGPHP